MCQKHFFEASYHGAITGLRFSTVVCIMKGEGQYSNKNQTELKVEKEIREYVLDDLLFGFSKTKIERGDRGYDSWYDRGAGTAR